MALRRREGASRLLRRARREGNPLVDPLRGRPRVRKITLVFRGERKTRNVVVMGNLTSWDPPAGRMERIPRSRVWTYSREVPDDLRSTYQLAPDDSLVPFDKEKHWKRRQSGWRVDPLNPRRFVLPKDSGDRRSMEWASSLVELPRAPRDPLARARPRVPKGTLVCHRLKSRILRNERRVWVYEPPPGRARSGGPPNLIIAFDGFAHTEVIPVPTLLDNLQAQGNLGPTWMVSVDSLTQKDRSRELGCYPPFVKFLSQEVLPWVQRRTRHRVPARRTVLAGQSMGGMAALHAMTLRPDQFGGVLSQSASLSWAPPGGEPAWLARSVAVSDSPPRRIFMEAGSLETATPYRTFPSLLESNRHMRDVLVAKGHDVSYREFHGGHDYACWRESFSTGLRWLFAHPTERR